MREPLITFRAPVTGVLLMRRRKVGGEISPADSKTLAVASSSTMALAAGLSAVNATGTAPIAAKIVLLL